MCLQNFIAYIRNQFDKCTKVIRNDNGSEVLNTAYDNMYKKLGIIHQRICIYTPQQNRVTERKHKHTLKVTRAIRFQVNIPITYWGHCVLVSI